MVLGAIDTGARFTHEALVESYRGNLGAKTFSHHYHWWDAVNGKEEPYDDHGHGSHVVGIMAGGVGSGGAIGVAPGRVGSPARQSAPAGLPGEMT